MYFRDHHLSTAFSSAGKSHGKQVTEIARRRRNSVISGGDIEFGIAGSGEEVLALLYSSTLQMEPAICPTDSL